MPKINSLFDQVVASPVAAIATPPRRRLVTTSHRVLVAGILFLVIWMLGTASALAQPNGQLSVVTYNPGGIDPQGEQSWEVRSARFVDWLVRHQQAPDIIAFQQVDGWVFAGIRPCGRGFGVGLGDYEQLDILMQQLRDRIGTTYRIAYLTGMERVYGDPLQCKAYSGQALLYNPTRLINLTVATTSPTLSHDQIDGLQGIPHLRRSLPLCNRGTHPVMPLETLIDGAPQTDKCGRQTPSGPVWSVLRREGHIAATAVRLAYATDPSSVIDVFNVNPTTEQEAQELPIIKSLIAAMPAPQTEGLKRYYPPLLVGDLNHTHVTDYPSFDLVMETPPADYIRVGIGQENVYPAQFKASFRDGFIIPDLPTGVPCQGTPDILVSDHCVLLVRFAQAPAADALRAVKVDGPTAASTGSPYHLTALVTGGGGRTLSYVWQPGGATTAAIDPVAGAPRTSQTWQVTVSDPSGGSVTASHLVRFFPDITACLDGCAQARDACFAAVAGAGGPRPQTCTVGFNVCVKQCKK